MSRNNVQRWCLAPLLVLAAALPAQEPPSHEGEALFYRAFFVERGLEQPEEALSLYRQYLDLAPADPLAGQAARFAIQILEKAGRGAEAKALRERHARVLAETTPAGINAEFLDPNADVAALVTRFESESREIFVHRQEIAALVGLQPGQAVADIGAGTGLFTNLFARQVGAAGKVYAVEIGPKLVEHLRQLGRTMQLPQVEAVLCSERSTALPDASLDVAFVCDTYHHFTHPRDTLASLHRALRPRGQLVIIDFERIEGTSRPWIFDHVRAGRAVFTAEIEAAGFRLVRAETTPFLGDNYRLRFERRDER